MQKSILIFGFWICFFYSTAHAMTADCDLLGDTLLRKPMSDKMQCWQACLDSQPCQGAVFVSGWQNCHLLAKVKRSQNLKLFAEFQGQGGYNKDFTGKDLAMVETDGVDSCRSACRQNGKCIGFTYIEGYRSCWLKHTKGKLIEKTFYCRSKR